MRTYLHDRVRSDKMCTTPDDDPCTTVWRDIVHGAPEELQVVEPACSVGINHQEPLPTCIEHPVTHRTALAQILLQSHYADITFGVLPREAERRGRGIVRGAVVDDEYLE